MVIVGEKINTSRKSVREAVEKKDALFIRNLARQQAEGGADYIDINCGTFVENEEDFITWLVEEVQDEIKLPLCIDSPNPLALEAGLKANRNGQAMINSISGEKKRYEAVAPLVQKFGCKVVVLCMDDESGIPPDAKTRVDIAVRVIEGLKEMGTKDDDIYIDPLIQPVSTATANAFNAVETIRMIKNDYPEINTICGLSNISYGLPERKLLNQTFAVLCIAAGLDCVILDPNDKRLMSMVTAANVLLDKDPFCGRYIKAYRQGLFNL